MDLYLLIGTAPYFCFLVIIFSGLLFRKLPKINQNDISFVSVVIAARNEENNISYLLEDLINQSANKNNYCLGCFTKKYPIPVQLEMDKMKLDEKV